MTVNAFIGLVKNNKLRDLNYHELLIDERGHVFLASPSLHHALEKLVARKTNRVPMELCNEIPMDCNSDGYLADKYNIVQVWINRLENPLNVNDVQIEAIRKLKMAKIISETPVVICTSEYTMSLWRNKVKDI